MRTRIVGVLAAAGVAAVALAAPQDRPGQTQPDRANRAADQPVTLDGEWTVVSAARAGAAVDGADKMTVSIKGNTVTFNSAAAGGPNKMRAMRLDFSGNGRLTVREANGDGKFDTPGGTGTTGTAPPATTTPPPAGGTDANRATDATRTTTAGAMSGVYVLTPDFLAISVFEPSGSGTRTAPATGTGTGTNPGTTPPADAPAPPAGGTAAQPGGTGPGGSAGITALGPQMKTHVSVVLRKAGAGTSRP